MSETNEGTPTPPDDEGLDVRVLLRDRRKLTWRQRFDEPDRYGILLVMIFTLMIVVGILGENRADQLISVALLGAVLAFTMKTSRASKRLTTAVLGGGLVLLVASFVAGAADIPQLREFTSAVSFLLILAMIAAIARRLGTHLRVSWSMLAGALCGYLLVGMLFSTLYVFLSEVEGGSIFAQISTVNTVDTMYFSFITMTTVGYGDLTPAQDLPRMIAVTEALFGQIYLVAAVGLLVGNMGRERRLRTRSTE